MPFKRLFGSQEKNKENDLQAQDAPVKPNSPPVQSSRLPDQDTVDKQTTAAFYEKDNRATRILRLSQAVDFWKQFENRYLKVPFLRYVFDSEVEAVEALLSLDCIHQAGDTGHLLCTEPIVMGCYRTLEGCYEVFLAGNELSYPTWAEAVRKFSDRHGRHRDQFKPETDERYKDRPGAQQVVFEKEYYQLSPEGTSFYKVFKAPSVQAARSFLLQHENMIMVRNRSILVETPEGTICSDIDGIHEMSRNADSRKPKDHSV